MSEQSGTNSPSNLPPSIAAPPPPPYYQPPPRPQVVHIVAKPGGFARAFGFVVGLFLLGAIFVIGLTAGMLIISGMTSYDSLVVRRTYRDGGSNTIAIIPVTGTIDHRQAEFVHAAVESILKDKSIRAVVLRVDSPGGEIAPSDQIWNEINRLKDANLPVVASYGGVAASGGYYISCGADYIMAEETCITGSIGVIAQVLTMEGLLNKVGIEPVTMVASGSPQKDIANDIFRTWNEADKTTVRILLDSAYVTFNKRVKDGRGQIIADPAKIDALANGSIYTAAQAKEHGLVDGIGYLDDAIAQAETLGKMATGSSTAVIIRQPPSLFRDALFMQSRGGGLTNTAFDASAIRGLVNDLAAPRVMYLMK